MNIFKEIKELKEGLDKLRDKFDRMDSYEDRRYDRMSSAIDRMYSNSKILVREQWLTTFEPPFKIGQKIEEGVVVDRLVHEVAEKGVVGFFVWKFIVVDDNEKKYDLFCWGNGKRITLGELERRKGLL